MARVGLALALLVLVGLVVPPAAAQPEFAKVIIGYEKDKFDPNVIPQIGGRIVYKF